MKPETPKKLTISTKAPKPSQANQAKQGMGIYNNLAQKVPNRARARQTPSKNLHRVTGNRVAIKTAAADNCGLFLSLLFHLAPTRDDQLSPTVMDDAMGKNDHRGFLCLASLLLQTSDNNQLSHFHSKSTLLSQIKIVISSLIKSRTKFVNA